MMQSLPIVQPNQLPDPELQHSKVQDHSDTVTEFEHENRRWKMLKRRADKFRRAFTLPRAISRARRGMAQLPRVLTHTITFGCNAKCVMCDSWQLPTGDDLKLEEIEAIYRNLPKMDAVRLTGGEPFVRRDFPQIYHLALDHLYPFMMHVSTNGFLTRRIVEFCHARDRGVHLELAISLDGIGDYHDRIRGKTTAWQTAFKTLEQLAPLQKKLSMTLVVNQTIVDSDGMQQHRYLGQILERLKVEHHVVVAYAESATYSLDRDRRVDIDAEYQTQNELSQSELVSLLDRAEREAGKLSLHRRIMRQYYLRGMRERIEQQRSIRNPVCQALHTHLRMFPNGDVPVCQFNSKIVGNLRNQSFAHVWTSSKAAEERSWVRDCSGCWAECEVAPSALYTLDMLPRSRAASED